MVLRKITIDNSVKYIPITEKEIKQNTTKNKKFNLFQEEANKIKIFHKTVKNSLKLFQHQDSNILQISICTSIQC